MFPNLFHISLTDEGLIALSVRSSENRSDEFFFAKEDIVPALDDDPTDDEWSGSEVFQLKRKRTRGSIRIESQGHWVHWTVRRQDIEILNAHLKAACEEAEDGLERPEAVVIHSDFKKTSSQNMLSQEDLLREMRTMLREELRKCILALEAPSVLRKEAKQEELLQHPSVTKPADTFIPSDLAQGLEGTVSVQGSEHKSVSALEAAKKLKEIKK